MHPKPTVDIKSTSQGWYQLRDREGLFAAFIDSLRDVPGCEVVARDGYVDLNMPENVLAAADWSLLPWVTGLPPHVIVGDRLGATVVLPARPMFPHQQEAVSWLLRVGGGLLADDMGLGKTTASAVAVESYARAQAPDRVRLIVGPGNVEGVWRRELAALGFISAPGEMAAATGHQAYERNLRGNLDSRWLFVPYHLMDKWLHFARANRCGGACAVIVDEAHWARNPRSERGRATRVAAQLASFRVLLTGTPISNRTGELWNVLSALDGARAWGSQHDFRLRYCGAVYDGHGYRDLGPTNVSELKARMQRRYLRRTPETAGLQLPSFRREVFPVQPTESELVKYTAAVERIGADRLHAAVAELRSGAFGRDTLRVMTQLRKTTSRLKMRATSELVTECREQGQSVVVFTWEKATAARLAAAAPGVSYTITGDLTQSQREAALDAFQFDTGGSLFATIDSIKEGVTLTRATRVIMHDQSWVPSDILQAERRVARIGQTKPVVATWMLLAGSFDAVLVDLLSRKAAEIEKVLDIPDAADAMSLTEGFGHERLDAQKLLDNWARPLTQGTP